MTTDPSNWGEEFWGEMVNLIRGYVERQTAPLLARIDALDKALAAMPVPRDGADGVGFDDLSFEYDGERSLVLRFVKGDRVKEFPVPLPIIIDRGIYEADGAYVRGDAVTFGGALWICQADTDAKPGTNTDWRLAVKKGRDGRDGVTKIKHVGGDGQ